MGFLKNLLTGTRKLESIEAHVVRDVFVCSSVEPATTKEIIVFSYLYDEVLRILENTRYSPAEELCNNARQLTDYLTGATQEWRYQVPSTTITWGKPNDFKPWEKYTWIIGEFLVRKSGERFVDLKFHRPRDGFDPSERYKLECYALQKVVRAWYWILGNRNFDQTNLWILARAIIQIAELHDRFHSLYQGQAAEEIMNRIIAGTP